MFILVPLHGLAYLGYYLIFERNLNYPIDIYRISRWLKFIELTGEDIDFAFRLIRKVFSLFGLRQVCLHSSVVLFWLSDRKIEIHFSIAPPMGHAWVRYLDRVYTTDHSFDGEAVYTMTKSSENKRDYSI